MRIEINYPNLQNLQRKLTRLQRLGLTKTWLGGIGEILQYRHRKRHKRQVDPNNRPWQRLSPLTLANKKHPDMLYETGDMLNSLSYQLRGSQLLLGFSDEKAKWHHFGTRPYKIKPKNKQHLYIPGIGQVSEVNHPGLPARPLLGINPKDGNAIYEYLEELVDDAVRS